MKIAMLDDLETLDAKLASSSGYVVSSDARRPFVFLRTDSVLERSAVPYAGGDGAVIDAELLFLYKEER